MQEIKIKIHPKVGTPLRRAAVNGDAFHDVNIARSKVSAEVMVRTFAVTTQGVCRIVNTASHLGTVAIMAKMSAVRGRIGTN